jgi:hypothetical protein
MEGNGERGDCQFCGNEDVKLFNCPRCGRPGCEECLPDDDLAPCPQCRAFGGG